MTNTPQLGPADWIVTGREIIAWVNDIEFFDITGSVNIIDNSQRFSLRFNNAATATTLYVGESDTVQEAMGWASRHLSSGILQDLQEELTCPHGFTLAYHCKECENS
jgi:hypothetical protein